MSQPDDPALVPHAVVEIDDCQWDSWKHKRLFEKVSVELVTNEASEAVWQIFDPELKVLDRYTTDGGVPMALVRFYLGFGSELGQPLFKGLLARVEVGDNATTLRSYDMGFKMRLIKKTEHYSATTDAARIKKLAERNGLLFVGPTKEELKDAPKVPKHKGGTQDEQTDWEHALECAERAGLVLFVRDDTLFAKPPAKTKEVPDATLTFKKDFDILHDRQLLFRTPENVAGRPKEVRVRGRGRSGKRLEAAAESGDRGRKDLMTRTDLPSHTTGAVKHRAHAARELQREHAYTASLRTISPLPNKRIDVRETVLLKNVGKLFSGKYLTDRISHELTPGSLVTNYELYRDAIEQ